MDEWYESLYFPGCYSIAENSDPNSCFHSSWFLQSHRMAKCAKNKVALFCEFLSPNPKVIDLLNIDFVFSSDFLPKKKGQVFPLKCMSGLTLPFPPPPPMFAK